MRRPLRETVVLVVLLAGCSGRNLGIPTDACALDWKVCATDAGPSADTKLRLPDLPQPCPQYASYQGGKRISKHQASSTLIFSTPTPRAALVTYMNSTSHEDLIVVDLNTGSSKVIATGVTSIMRLGTDDTRLLAISGSTKTLSVYPLEGGQATPLGTNVCKVFPARDGARVYFLTDCSKHSMPEKSTDIGTLRVAEVKSGAVTTITKGAAAAGLGISNDGTRAAFLTKMVQGPGNDLGTLVEWRSGKGLQTLADKVGFKYRLSYLGSDHLLFHQWVAGSTFKLMRHDPITGKIVKLAQDRVFHGTEYIWYTQEYIYEISTDEKYVIGSPQIAAPYAALDLYAVGLDGSGEKAIAGDLYGRSASGPMWTWRFTPDGKYLIYMSQIQAGGLVQYAFKALTWPDLASRVAVTCSGFIQGIEDLTHEVLYADYTKGSLHLASLVTGKSRTLFSGPPNQHVYVQAKIPRGRGFLLGLPDGASAGASQLAVVSLSGKATHFGAGKFLYRIDSTGCAFAFSRSQGQMPGTYVAQVP